MGKNPRYNPTEKISMGENLIYNPAEKKKKKALEKTIRQI
jgi:hypothetical protein